MKINLQNLLPEIEVSDRTQYHVENIFGINLFFIQLRWGSKKFYKNSMKKI